MLLSDELLKIGQFANPKNNLSMYQQESVMITRVREAHKKGSSIKQLYNIVNMVCNQLNKQGYNYFNVDHFFVKNQEGVM